MCVGVVVVVVDDDIGRYKIVLIVFGANYSEIVFHFGTRTWRALCILRQVASPSVVVVKNSER